MSDDFEDVPPPPDPLEALLVLVTADIKSAYTLEARVVMEAIYADNAGAYLEACDKLRQANRLVFPSRRWTSW